MRAGSASIYNWLKPGDVQATLATARQPLKLGATMRRGQVPPQPGKGQGAH